ncbi:MAG: GNAT family N-acetyltransferase [Chloroflexi bacterium]|nr:GNAT family N-acetyltransferase [Chloroflexota bacterium]MCI0855411.1 GNAT family N-acetyltransferase [Chloroflexota bacterium]MCI0889482.1 GNAT family N-acetyltransferase [Chloroflexota bacterium]
MTFSVQREELAQLQPEWVQLLERQSEPVPFQHPSWQRVWLEEFQDGRDLLLLAVRDGEELVGVAPLLRDGEALTLVGHYSICDYMDFVVAEDRCREVFEAILAGLQDEAWSRLELRGLREGSTTLTALPQAAESRGMTVQQEEEAVAPRIELPGDWEEYVSSLKKKHRHELRRKLRNLQGAGDLELRTYTSPKDVELHLPVLLRFMVESREDKARFLSEQMGLFFHKATQALAEEGLIRLYELELDGKPVASVLCFDQGGQLYMYNSGYDPEYAPMSVGIVSKALCLQAAIADGKHRIDLLRGDEEYKYRLGAQNQQIYRLSIRR